MILIFFLLPRGPFGLTSPSLRSLRILAKATSFSTILLAGMLFFSFLDTVSKVLLFLSRRWRKLPGRGRPVTAKNVKVGGGLREWLHKAHMTHI